MLISKLILDEINSLRTDPPAYAEKILKYKDLFEGKKLKRPDGIKIETLEGPGAYAEAANYLKSHKPVGTLTASKGLTKIAEDILQVAQTCDAGAIDSRINVKQLIDRYGSFEGGFGRLMEFGGTTPEIVVIDLVVSDGDKSRSQRSQLLDKTYRVIGLVAGDHPDYKKCTMITLANKVNYKDDPDDVENY